MWFIELFTNPIFGAISTFGGTVFLFDTLYFRFMPEKIQNKVDVFICNLPQKFKTKIIRNKYIDLFERIDKKINKNYNNWNINNEQFYNKNLFIIICLIFITPGIILSIKNKNIIIFGQFPILLKLLMEKYLPSKKMQKSYKKGKYSLLILNLTFIYTLISLYNFLIAKNELLGIGFCAEAITTLLFGLTLFISVRSLAITRIFIHKCSYGQNTKQLITNNIEYLFKTFAMIMISILFIFVVSRLTGIINLIEYRDITTVLRLNKSYLFFSILVFSFFILFQIILILFFIIFSLISLTLFIWYMAAKILYIKKLYTVILGIFATFSLAYFISNKTTNNTNAKGNIVENNLQEEFDKSDSNNPPLNNFGNDTKAIVEEDKKQEEPKSQEENESSVEDFLTEEKSSEVDNSLEEIIPIEELELPPLNE